MGGLRPALTPAAGAAVRQRCRTGGSGGEQLRPGMTGGVVGAVVGPAAPQDPSPAGAETAQGPVLALAAAPCVLVDDLRPGIFAAGHEGPPVDGVSHSPVCGIAEPDLPGAWEAGETSGSLSPKQSRVPVACRSSVRVPYIKRKQRSRR